LRPHEVDLRPRAADCINKLIKAKKRAELGVGGHNGRKLDEARRQIRPELE